LWRTARMVVASAARVPTAGAALAAALMSSAREAGLAPDVRSWRPHVTLLRGVAPQSLPPPATSAGDSWPLAPLTLPVSRFYLAQSQGLGAQACGAMEARRYATLASWPLRA
jgi:2'-5' RNA ligase